MNVVVYGLWHLGCVTATCLATAGHRVVGLDRNEAVVADLGEGRPPIEEPGLADAMREAAREGRLTFTSLPAEALAGADLLWVTFDTPVDARDRPDAEMVRAELDAIADAIPVGTLVLISAQVPIGFTGALAREWTASGLRYGYVAENLRLGAALESFRRPGRVVAGVRDPKDRSIVSRLLAFSGAEVQWMSVESAEMAKHALNAFLAVSVGFANELARLCEAVGADAKAIELALRSDPRVGSRAYVSPGAAFAGGTLARDIRVLQAVGDARGVDTPLLDGLFESNERQRGWTRETLRRLLANIPDPVVAVLGLTYKPGTSTLRRSEAVETCAWLAAQGVEVRAHDPAVPRAAAELDTRVTLCPTSGDALAGADLALIATPWPAFRELDAEGCVSLMRHPRVVDPGWFLEERLGHDPRITYAAVGRGRPESDGRG